MDNAAAAINVIEYALEQCRVIRRDHAWTKSDDSRKLHEFILRDVEANFLPMISGPAAVVMQGAINGAREAFAF